MLIAKNLYKRLGDPPQDILKDINLQVSDGEFLALTGRSGSGKSTLLYILSSLDKASSGSMLIDNSNLNQISDEELHHFRNQSMGFIFQFHYLLPELTALENVLMPTYKFNFQEEKRKRADELLELVGLSHRRHHLPHHLSGGEQQRVAVARALVMNPKYLFADEPTGALDTNNAEAIMQLLGKINREQNTTIVMVTHDPDFAAMAQRQVVLSDGRIISDKKQN